jgi:hypothetical protein
VTWPARYGSWEELAESYLVSLAEWKGEEDEARRRDVAPRWLAWVTARE